MGCIRRNQGASRRLLRVLACAALSGLVACATTPSSSSGASEQQQLVDKARMTWERFAAHPVMNSELRDWLRVAKGVFIVPQIIRGAFVFGGAGGSGVLLVRDEKTGEWSQPAFYTIGSASFGLQIGGDVSEVIFVVRSQRGLEQFYGSQFKLGMDIGVAAGPAGGSMSLKGITADLFVYALAKGLFGGTALDGSIIAALAESNQAYYGQPVRPADILAKGSVRNPQSEGLRNAVAQGMR